MKQQSVILLKYGTFCGSMTKVRRRYDERMTKQQGVILQFFFMWLPDKRSIWGSYLEFMIWVQHPLSSGRAS